ncbi:sensor histidine kinase [Conexibacter sp. SYSU D00693]|uniref:sensor histidine kinase n=1 Tax=Conexibacter sp. SYSU D00693 TaxID=2812560 RepID=UPI00196A5864|nr:histidine kinase [Conexibacter sp. SYSU D00693]
MDVSATPAPDQVQVLEAFVELLDQVEDGGEGPAFYGRLAEAVCRTSEMRRALVFRYDPGRRRVRVVGGHGMPYEDYVDVPVGLESMWLARQSLLEDTVIDAEPPFAGQLPEAFLPEADEGPLLCVPMCARGLLLGVVVGQRVAGAPPLSAETRHRLWTLGKTAALASTARIATDQQSKARTLQERIDLARDVHDHVIQRLFGVSLALAAGGEDLPAAERVRCAEEVQAALTELRAALARPLGRGVRPVSGTLAEELDRLHGAHPGVAVEVTGDASAVPPGLEALAQTVLAEAVSNALKHASPTVLRVSAGRRDDAFVLEVANDGVRDADRSAPPGMGLRLAAFSALEVGGLVEFGPRPDGWWQVRLVAPVGGTL